MGNSGEKMVKIMILLIILLVSRHYLGTFLKEEKKASDIKPYNTSTLKNF